MQEKPVPDLFATTGDYLRIWKVSEDGKSTEMECVLNDVSAKRQCVHTLTHLPWIERVLSVLRPADGV